jgi:hypothetical protein
LSLGYRARQFWNTLTATPSPEYLKDVRALLNPKQVEFFERLSPADQAHAIRVMNWLRRHGEDHPDLLVSALLHDVGKTRYPLSVWERVIGVVFSQIFPSQAEMWGAGELEAGSWKRIWLKPFVIARQHPRWSAEMVAQSGGSSRVVYLIRNHQNDMVSEMVSIEDMMLNKLQIADRNN